LNGHRDPGSASGACQGPPGAQSPFARSRCSLLRRGVAHLVRGHDPSFKAPTGSCARPQPSCRLQSSLFRQVFAGCRQSLLGDGPSRRSLRASVSACPDPSPGASPGAHTRFFPGNVGLRRLRNRLGITPSSVLRLPYGGRLTGLQSFTHVQTCGCTRHPGRSYRRGSSTGQPWLVRPSLLRVVTSPHIG
jgi:hypothetical protein